MAQNSFLQDAISNFYTNLPAGEVVNGLAVGVINGVDASGNPIITTCCSGYANAEQQTPVDEQTVFQIGSVTKTFTTTMLAQAVEAELVTLDVDAQFYLPASDVTLPVWPANGTAITILDLADYTSGLPDKSPPDLSGHGEYTTEMLYSYLNNVTLAAEPGTTYKYVNTNFGLLADVVKGVNPYADYSDALSSLITAAELQMPNTLATHHDHPAIDNLAQGYKSNGDVEPHYALPTWPALIGAGGIYSTLSDMLYWLQFNMNLTDSPYNDLLQTTQFPRFKDAHRSMGLGWFLEEVPISPFGMTVTMIFKDGGTDGFHSWIGFLSGMPMGVVLLCNADLSGALAINNGQSPLDVLGASILKTLAENSTS